MTITVGRSSTSTDTDGSLGGPDRFRRVVVPVANPREAPLLMSIARTMVDPDEGELLAITVVTDDAEAESLADTVAHLHEALDASFGPDHGIEVQRRTAPAVARGILDFVSENNPDLVVMGTKATANGHRFGAVAEAVVEGVHCGVLAIRPSEEIGIERVIVGIDGSSDSAEALSLAVLVSAGLSVPLTAIHVRDPALSRTFAASVLAEAADLVPEWLKADGYVIEASATGRGLLGETRATDLLFLGSAHRRGVARLSSGGTLERALRSDSAHVAVLAHRDAPHPSPLKRIQSWLQRLHPRLTPLERESVQWRARSAAPLTADYMILLGVAALLASFGLLQNSVAVVIGAMLVAPLLGPLSAASTAIATAQIDLLGRSLFTLLVGAVGTVVLALAVGAAIPIDVPTSEMLARGSPSLVDLCVAVAAGVVGAYATARKDIPAALAGVAIAAVLVPPICTTGLALGLGDLSLATGSLLLFTVNTVSVVLVGAVVLWWMGVRPEDTPGRQATALAALIATALAFVTVIAGIDAFQGARQDNLAEQDVRDLFPAMEVVEVESEGDDPLVVTAVIRTSQPLDSDVVLLAELGLTEKLGRPVELRVVEQRVVTARPAEDP